jgi:hypothetical protein
MFVTVFIELGNADFPQFSENTHPFTNRFETAAAEVSFLGLSVMGVTTYRAALSMQFDTNVQYSSVTGAVDPFVSEAKEAKVEFSSPPLPVKYELRITIGSLTPDDVANPMEYRSDALFEIQNTSAINPPLHPVKKNPPHLLAKFAAMTQLLTVTVPELSLKVTPPPYPARNDPSSVLVTELFSITQLKSDETEALTYKPAPAQVVSVDVDMTRLPENRQLLIS